MSNHTNISCSMNNNSVNTEAYTQSVDHPEELSRFRHLFDIGYNLDHINKENMLEERRERLAVLLDRKETLEKQLEGEIKYVENRPSWIKKLVQQEEKKEKELAGLRSQYANNNRFFIKNAWRFASTIKDCPEWFGLKVIEDNLDNFEGEGIQVKDQLVKVSNKKKALIDEINFDLQFGISNMGMLKGKISSLESFINKVTNNLSYDEKEFDNYLNEEEEEFVVPTTSKGVFQKDYPNEDWTDEQLTMLISCSEDGRGVYAAERILNQRREEEAARRESKMKNSKAKGMKEIMELAEFAAQTRRFVAKAEKDGIVQENKDERRRIKNLLSDKEEKMTCVAVDKVWYSIENGVVKETINPDKVTFGYTEIIFVPVKCKMDALYHRAYSSFTGKVEKISEAVIDERECNFEEEEYTAFLHGELV